MNNQEMTRRRPGDYVVNAELTPEQIRRFVADCENNGCRNRGDHIWWPVTTWNLNTLDSTIVNQVENTVEGVAEEYLFKDNARNVTHEYKEKQIPADNGPDLPTVLEECAEHLRAGRDPLEYFEMCNGPARLIDVADIVAATQSGIVRRKPTHKTPTEDDVGRLVMVRLSGNEEWQGPHVLRKIDGDGDFSAGKAFWDEAKLYTGPTRPNWIEHDGRGRPDGVEPDTLILYQDRAGAISADRDISWWDEDYAHDVARYAIIEP